MDSRFTFIDLFCGIGGFHLAMSSIGGECVFASDIDSFCRKVYASNFGIEPKGDITKIDAREIPSHDVLCAGFPCQSFSKAGNRLGFNDPTKGTLFFELCRIIEFHRPKYLLLENVRNLASHDNGNTWKVIHERLANLGYEVPETPYILSPHMIGIPQHRERVYITGIRRDVGRLPGVQIGLDEKKECSPFSILENDDDIENIDQYAISSQTIELLDIWNDFIKETSKERTPCFPIWSEYLRSDEKDDDFSSFPSWKVSIIKKNIELYKKHSSFIDKWLARAKTNKMFINSKSKFEWQAGPSKTPDIWNNIIQFRPSGIRVKASTFFPALVAIVQIPIFGPRKRLLTPRECARLQSFPDSFIIDKNKKQAYKQFGNSVNVEIVKQAMKSLLLADGECCQQRKISGQLELWPPKNVESGRLC